MPTVPQEVSRQDVPESELDLVHRAVDHAIAVREVVDRITDPVLRTLTDTLLFELGRRLARLEGKEA